MGIRQRYPIGSQLPCQTLIGRDGQSSAQMRHQHTEQQLAALCCIWFRRRKTRLGPQGVPGERPSHRHATRRLITNHSQASHRLVEKHRQATRRLVAKHRQGTHLLEANHGQATLD